MTPPDDDSTGTDPGTTDPGTDPGSDAGTDPGADSSADNCATPEVTHDAAMAEGQSEIYPAGDAGTVEVVRTTGTNLQVGEVVASDGWASETTAASGPRIKVRFVNTADPANKVRFTASMDQAGEEIHVKVTSCG